jgi:anthranilate synthase component 1
VPVVTLPGTPDLLGLHIANPQRYPFLLETQGNDGWDILFAFPQPSADCTAFPFFPFLERAWQESTAIASETGGLPFTGGWFVYLGYELLHELEPSVRPRISTTDFPLAQLVRIPAALMVNRAQQQTCLFAESGHDECLMTMQADLGRATPVPDVPVQVENLLEEASEAFIHGVARIKSYIREGDVFQVNLARRWQGRLSSGSAAQLYARLRRSNPAPFSGMADFGRFQIVSSSPERLVQVRDSQVETRPIAGTHPRSHDPAEDETLRQALISSQKERAEHIMLIDLERNDLGRICQPGSVEVNELMAVRSYAHVHHIESNVRGRLRTGVTPAAVLRALFPGGTITGCPKVRTMQIIRELEASPRDAYTGSMGYINRDGSLDMNILIRTFMLKGERLSFKAGAGIVADSDPQRELNETRVKAKGLLNALGIDQHAKITSVPELQHGVKT